MKTQKVKRTWKQKLIHEFREYLINVIYMTLFFSAVIFYRRLVLAQHGIIIDDYFLGLIKALVIGKVVMIGGFLRISGKYEHKPLIIPTIYKAVLFTIWVMVFDIIEIYIKAFIKTPDLAEAFKELLHHFNPAWFGAAVVICVSFLPFFALKELSRLMGSGMLRALFFKKQAT
jgi:hypothetical protein